MLWRNGYFLPFRSNLFLCKDFLKERGASVLLHRFAVSYPSIPAPKLAAYSTENKITRLVRIIFYLP